MSKHTPEPWADYEDHTFKTLSALDYARARACVNACTGIPTSALSEGCVRKAFKVLARALEVHGDGYSWGSDARDLLADLAKSNLADFTKEGSDQ